jgi:hypothetical protein
MRALVGDLAATFSAFQIRDGSQVLVEWDTRGETPFGTAKKIRRMADEYAVDLILLETVPQRVKFHIDRIFRLQGIIFAYLHPYFEGDRIFLVFPQTWQKHYPGVGSIPKGVDVPKAHRDAWRAEEARKHALARGYAPPDLVEQYIASLPEGARVLKKHTDPLAKSMTDYVDAFLIGDWLYSIGTVDELRRTTGVQPPMI